MMYSAYKLNNQGDNIQPWRTPFPIWNQSVVPCPVLTVASWLRTDFLRGRSRWSGIPISLRIFQFVVIHTVKGFGIVSKAEVDVFLELSCFFDDPADVGNLISGSSAFSKSRLNIWKFTVYVLLKLQLSCVRLFVPHGLQHTRPPCPSLTPGVYSNSDPLSQGCHPAISSSVILFSSCLQSFPASESFQLSQLFTTVDQSTGVSASTSVLPVNSQDCFPLG